VAYPLWLFYCFVTTNQPDTPLFFNLPQTPDSVITQHKDYVTVIKRYLVLFFRNYKVNGIDYKLLDEFDAWRIKEMGKKPKNK